MSVVENEPKDLTRLRKFTGTGKFATEAIRRVEALRLGINSVTRERDRELPWKPGGKFHKNAGAMARRCLKALKISEKAPGMLVKIDRGDKTLTNGRILITGIVQEATAAFMEPPGGSAKILHILRIKDCRGRIWDETGRVTSVHKFEAVNSVKS